MVLERANNSGLAELQGGHIILPWYSRSRKTMLASIVIDDITTRFENDETVGIGYVYCNYRRADEQRAKDLLASLLKQLAQGQTLLPACVESMYNKHKDKLTRASIKEISKALHTVAAMYSKVFIVVDALDECQVSDDCRSKVLDEIFHLQTACGVNFMATSRSIPEISERFSGAKSVTISATAEDVRKYVDGHLSELPSFVRRSPELKEEVLSGIIRVIDGMFQLAKLHLDSLNGKKSPKSLRNALEELPSGSDAYDQAYQNAMERIEGQREDQETLAKQVLYWITCALRPLSTMELRHALAVEFGERELDEDNLIDLEDIVSVCAGLVTIDEESDIIRLVHYTTQEFFERTQQQWFPSAESEISRICATYLSFAAFESGLCYTNDSFRERLQSNVFYDYAGNNWGHHARKSQILHRDVIDFLKCHNTSEASSQALMRAKEFPEFLEQRILQRPIAGLHLAAYFGVEQAVEALLEEGVDANSKDDTSRTPLSWAAANGHKAVVRQLLLIEGVDADLKDNYGQTPLFKAAEAGHTAVVQLLLAKDSIDVNSRDDNGCTSLHCASTNGYEAIVKLLLATKGVEADAKDDSGQTPLSWAAETGCTAVVELLLAERRVNANSKDCSNRTPLSLASCIGHEAIVKLLLATEGVDAQSRDLLGRTPLAWAAFSGREAIVELLLNKGVDAESKDEDGLTPLSLAAEKGCVGVVALLLAIGVDINSKDYSGRTPLSWAAAGGRDGAVELLVSIKGIDVDAKDNAGRTPLSWAAAYTCPSAAAELLLAMEGVDANSVDCSGRTPLSHAAGVCNEGVVKVLLSIKGIRADAKDNAGRTPLSWAAAYWRLPAAAKLLAMEGVDANSGRLPYSWTSSVTGTIRIVELLLAVKGVDVGAKDNAGQTPLSWARASGHDAMVTLLQAQLGK